MAQNTRRVNDKRQRKRAYYSYENGSAVRELEEPSQSEKKTNIKKASSAKKKAYSVGRGYVIFLSVICTITLVLCVVYLQKKATITSQYENIATLESQYNKLKNDNDAKYNQVIDSVSLEDIKDAALNRLGMHYATADQIKYYDLTDDSYVRQYKDVPDEE